MLDYVWLVPLFPAVGFIINGLMGKRIDRRLVGWIGCSAIGLSFFVSLLLLFDLLTSPI